MSDADLESYQSDLSTSSKVETEREKNVDDCETEENRGWQSSKVETWLTLNRDTGNGAVIGFVDSNLPSVSERRYLTTIDEDDAIAAEKEVFAALAKLKRSLGQLNRPSPADTGGSLNVDVSRVQERLRSAELELDMIKKEYTHFCEIVEHKLSGASEHSDDEKSREQLLAENSVLKETIAELRRELAKERYEM